MEHQKILIIDVVLIVGTLLTLIILLGYSTPLVISPIDNLTTTKSNVLFSIENAQTLLIDDNLEFTSPESYNPNDELTINLQPGTYYWKAVGIKESKIRTLTVESTVILELKKSDEEDTFNVVNAGNTVLDVEVYNNTKLVENIELTPNSESSFDGNKLIGSPKQ